MKTLIQVIADTLEARRNCMQPSKSEWKAKHEDSLLRLEQQLPHGSGFDIGTRIAFDECTESKVVFDLEFHHMDTYGAYTGWSTHQVIVTPAFNGFNVRVSGRNVHAIKEYIADIFHECLSGEAK